MDLARERGRRVRIRERDLLVETEVRVTCEAKNMGLLGAGKGKNWFFPSISRSNTFLQTHFRLLTSRTRIE